MTSPRRPRSPLLAATLIVKNEEQNLPSCLASLRGLVDEIVVYDTGSTDQTVAIAKDHGARVIEGYWDDDFARARNASLEAVRADWFLWVDADDRVCGRAGQALRSYLSGDTGIFPGAPPSASLDLIRLRVINVSRSDRDLHALESTRIARSSQVRWSGRIHEQLEPRTDSETGTKLRSIRLEPDLLHIRHSGYADHATLAAKAQRNVAIAQAQLDDLVAAGSQDAQVASRAAYDLARSLLMAGQTQDAVDALEVVREIAEEPGYRAMATLLLTQTLLDAGGHDDAAQFLVEELRSEGVLSAQFCDWLMAQVLARSGRRPEALELLRPITELVDPAGNRQSLERVLMARSLFAGAEGLLEESRSAMLDLVLTYGPREDRCLLLLKLWKGAYREAATLIAQDCGPFGADVVQVLDRLGPTGEQLADMVRRASSHPQLTPQTTEPLSLSADTPAGEHSA